MGLLFYNLPIPVSYEKENMTRRNRTKIMPTKVGLAVCRSRKREY
jgi:hypothetical protein